ncbi:MAG: glycoside hydrolase family 32 protein [Armatimonadetes bacterium]|nr:glycoside hydrolase family 32 protein [Armatimonadota bacterium]
MTPLFPTAALQDATLYDEPLRPQFHFTAKKGWLNDPNGLVFHKGRYHLFFQHNPFGVQWGNMTWGHAVSPDLVHWTELDSALTPDAMGTEFSGSAVIDKSGILGEGRGVMALFYTAAGGTNPESQGKPFTQCLATSVDGTTFVKSPGNPVLAHQEGENRDPKVVWHAPSRTWVMALYLADDRYGLFGSSDLKSWKKLSEVVLPGTSECPDFFELPVDGNRRNRLWVFWGANGNYRLGSFDGQSFRAGTAVLSTDAGPNFYAAQTYSDEPKGRRVQIGWMRGSDFKDCDWNQQMSFPRTVRLKSTPLGARLAFEPVSSLQSLRTRRLPPEQDGDSQVFRSSTGLFEIRGRWRAVSQGRFNLDVLGTAVSYDFGTKTMKIGSHERKIEAVDGFVDMTLLADRASLELFAQDGEVTGHLFAPADPAARDVRLIGAGGETPARLDVYELRSAWKGTKDRRSR